MNTPKLPPLPDLGPEWTPHWTKVVHEKMQSYAVAAIEAQGVPDAADLIAGALYDFLGHLTSMEKSIAFGANEWATPAVDALVQFAEKRRLTLNNPAIEKWTESLASASPAPHADARIPDAVEYYGGVKSDEELFPAQASVVQQEPVAHVNSNGVVHAAGYPWNPSEILRPLVYGDIRPAQQKPVFWYDEEDGLLYAPNEERPAGCIPLYTHPAQQAKPQPLSDEQISNEAIHNQKFGHLGWEGFHAGVRYAEAAHGIKE